MSLLTDQLKNEEMTLDEKLAAIDKMMNSKEMAEDFNRKNGRPLDAPVDPSEATLCIGCQ